jgi:molybdate transport system substrate-binding protein
MQKGNSNSSLKPLQVITSGAFAAALKDLTPLYEQKYQIKVDLSFGSSIGDAHDSIPTRLSQGQQFDVFILADSALDRFMQAGQIQNNTRVDLVASKIAAAVRAGDPEPDISTLASFKHTLLTYGRIAYSASASGTYLSTELFPKLGIEEEMSVKAKKIFSERVGTILMRNEADLGFQQMSELLPIQGIKILGDLPPEVQRSFFFSAGIGSGTQNEEQARHLIEFLASTEVADHIRKTGLQPVLAKAPWLHQPKG